MSFLEMATLVLQLMLAAFTHFSSAQTNSSGSGVGLGELDSPTYPFYIDDAGGPPAWTDNSTQWFDPYQLPKTGQTRTYDFTVKRSTAAPDGHQRQVILVNGQFPGPMIEANWGDMIEVTVHNEITGPEEGTAMHWHGLYQKENPWMDGVPSVSQCPIAPGSSFTYRFRAERFGTSWWHSHYSAQYSAGLFGPMLIHGPSHAQYDIDIGPVFLTDWYHREYFQIIQGFMGTDTSLWDQPSQNNLINGKGTFDCSKAIDNAPCSNSSSNAKFRFQSGKTHLLRLIGAGAEGFEYFSIDGHELEIIANDYVPIKPYKTNVVSLAIGQRTDVLVRATANSTASFWMRATNSLICGQTTQGIAVAEIHYENSDDNKPPSTAANFTDPGLCKNASDDLEVTEPYFPVPQPGKPDITQVLNIDRKINSTGHLTWVVNSIAFRGDYNYPLLEAAYNGNTSFPTHPEWAVYNFGQSKVVRLIVNNLVPYSSRLSHPMHIHGHDVFVVADGLGLWDNATIVRPENPMRRDTQNLRRGGYTVLDIAMDNPGVWPFHCHIAWHVSEGFYINILERPKDITQSEIPAVMKETCDAWDAWSANNVVAQIDSGLRRPRLKAMMEKEKRTYY